MDSGRLVALVFVWFCIVIIAYENELAAAWRKAYPRGFGKGYM